MSAQPPKHLDVKKTEGLHVEWADGSSVFYPCGYLRRMSPSADMRELRKAMQVNPLTVLPSAPAGGDVTITDAELVGNYAIRLTFSDGHSTGIYSWEYLREIDPANVEREGPTKSDRGPAHNNPLGLRRPSDG